MTASASAPPPAAPVDPYRSRRVRVRALLGFSSGVPLLLTGLHPLALPLRVVGILDRQLRQLDGLALAEACIKLHQLLDHDLHRPAVGDDVMQGHHQHMVIRSQTQQTRAYQRTCLQIKEFAGFLGNECLQVSLQGLALRQVQFIDSQCKRPWGQDHLQGLIILLSEHAAQAFVSVDQGLDAALQRSSIQSPLESQGRGDVISRALRRPLPEEPLPLLGIGQQQRFFGRALEKITQRRAFGRRGKPA